MLKCIEGQKRVLERHSKQAGLFGAVRESDHKCLESLLVLSRVLTFVRMDTIFFFYFFYCCAGWGHYGIYKSSYILYLNSPPALLSFIPFSSLDTILFYLHSNLVNLANTGYYPSLLQKGSKIYKFISLPNFTRCQDLYFSFQLLVLYLSIALLKSGGVR
jgi:hypothetical protein